MSDAPAEIGRYRIERVLGRGAMGVVYRAHDPEIDRPVAIKLVRADLLEGTERADYLARFRQEAQAAGRCTHPNIVALYDYAMHEGNPYLAMEFVDGVSLAQAIARGTRFRPQEAVYLVGQMLEALGCAHRLGVVHRDIKPGNVLLLPSGRVKVTDFGVSRIGGAGLTQHGSIVGTPSYMSPEQCRGEVVDARSDLFSAGVVLFELLSGERPFPGRNFGEIAAKLLHEAAPDLSARAPAPIAEVVRRALAKRPEDRFPAAEAMLAALRGPSRPSADPTIVVAPGSGRATDAAAVGLEPEVLDTLQRRLARYVGPIARRLLDSAVRSAPTLHALCDTLARSIDSPEERESFLREARRECAAQATRLSLTGAGTRTGTVGCAVLLPDSVLEPAVASLTRVLGPIARVLVQRAARKADTAEALWQALAAHIEAPAERAAFLARAPRR